MSAPIDPAAGGEADEALRDASGAFGPGDGERGGDLGRVVAALDGRLDLGPLRGFVEGHGAKWGRPDDLVIVDEVAKTSVGKCDKKAIRALLADRVLP